MLYLSEESIDKIFSYHDFIPYLKSFLTTSIHCPARNHLDLPETEKEKPGTLLLMPAWNESFLGVKNVVVLPDNAPYPAVQAQYQLYDRNNGCPLMACDGARLTVLRTAAVSGLASVFLRHKDADSLLVMGTGSLCPEIIKAHHAMYAPQHIKVWGRTFAKAQYISSHMKEQGIQVDAVKTLSTGLLQADVAVAATHAMEPFIYSKYLKKNVFLDLIGSYKPEMREAESSCFTDAAIYVDTIDALQESGDLLIPMQEGIIQRISILGTLPQMCSGEVTITDHPRRIFKSVGMASADLAIASYLYNKLPK